MFKKISKIMMAMAVAATVVTTVAAPATVEAKSKTVNGADGAIYIASFDQDKTNHVVSVKFDKKGNLIVKANFTRYKENARGFLKGKSTGTKTFKFAKSDFGQGLDGGTDYYLHNYKTGKTNPKFYHYTQDEFVAKCEAKMDSSWKLVVTTNFSNETASAAIVKYNGSYDDPARQGYKISITENEDSWAHVWHCRSCRERIGYGTEAQKAAKAGCDAHEGKFFK